ANPVFIFFLINVSPDVGLAVPANRPGIAKGTIFFAIGVVIGIVTVAITSLLEVAGIATILAIVMVASWSVQVAVAGVERVVRAKANERCWVAVVGIVLLNESRIVAGLKGTKFRITANRPIVDSEKVFFENGTNAHLIRNWVHETIQASTVDCGAFHSHVVLEVPMNAFVLKCVEVRPSSMAKVVIVRIPVLHRLE